MAKGDRIKGYAELGRFITDFGRTESLLHLLLRKLTGMSDKAARIICAGMRNSDLIKKLRGLLEIDDTNKDKKARLERIFKQFLIISEMRDHIVHRWSFVTNEGITRTNNALTSRKSAEYLQYELKTLTDASSDLGIMFFELFVVTGFVTATPPKEPGDPDNRLYLTYKWKYKKPKNK
jgi:hypothetical protein